MSQLIQALTVVSPGQRRALPRKQLGMTVDALAEHCSWQAADAYEVSATAMARVWSTNGNITLAQKAEAARMLVEHVYGEFRPCLRDLRMALMDQDVDAARTALDTLEQQMFSVGVDSPRT